MNIPPLSDPLELCLPDAAATDALAARFAPLVTGQDPALGEHGPGGRIHLSGDLGAGKTAFVRALLRACGITGRIKSPSYALLETYKVFNLYFYHLDFYRLKNPREWLDAGFRDILQKDAVVLIEWPQQAGSILPPPDLEISLSYADTGRRARLAAYTEKGMTWLQILAPALQDLYARDDSC